MLVQYSLQAARSLSRTEFPGVFISELVLPVVRRIMSTKIGFITPPKAAPGPSLSQVEKQRLIENLELEGEFRSPWKYT